MTLPEGLIYRTGFLTEAEEREVLGLLATFELQPYVRHDTPSRRLVRSFGLALVTGGHNAPGSAGPRRAGLAPGALRRAVVDDVPHPAARRGRPPVSGRTRLTVRVHPKARTERLEWTARRSSCGSASLLLTGGPG